MRYDILGINIIFAMVSAVLILIYLRINNINFNRNKSLIFAILFGFINGILATKAASLGDLINTIKPLLLMVISILIIKFILELKMVKAIIVFLLLMIGMGIGNAFGLLIMGSFIKGYVVGEITSNAILYFFSNLIVSAITILFLYAIKPVNELIRHILNSKDLAFVLISTFIIISSNVGLYYYIKVFNFTAFLILSLLSLLYCVYIIFNSTVLYNIELEKAEKEQQDFYNKSLENSLFNLRRFKHDWNNNLTVINSMLTMNKNNEAMEYLREIMEYNTKSNNTSIFSIKNAGLFGVISSKQGLAKEKGLDIEIKGVGEICTIPEIKISELCEIIGIFLDNAIEESEKIKENIELNYMESVKTIEISIKNKCKDNVDLNKIVKSSSKGTGRGNGLRIVDQIIEKYKYVQNFRSYESESKTFEQLLVIEKGL